LILTISVRRGCVVLEKRQAPGETNVVQAGKPAESETEMKKYQLFGEWRGVALYGNDLADALMRERTLRTPTRYAPKGPGWTAPVVIGGGEEWVVAGICDVFSPANSTRGGKPYLRAVVKFADNRIREVDAVEVV
jgi:hypothetical protein